jgi:tripartite-type tricarboxylate transporter receptor subunit TctC
MQGVLKKSLQAIAVLAATTAMVAPQAAFAQADYPDRPIKLIVGYSPGGATDIVARMIGASLEKRLGQPIVVDNKPGGGSNIGTAEAARAKPDGYTLLLGTIAQAINPAVYAKLEYDTLKDFVPVIKTMSAPSILVVNPDFKVNNLKEFLDWARANPGQLSMASSGAGGSPHMAAELLKLRTGIDYLHVPYKGAGPARRDVIAGIVMAGFKTATAAIPQIKAGKLRAIAVAAPQRLPQLPDVPTMSEAGLSDFDVASWNGLFAPAGTPAAIVEKLNLATNEVLKEPEIIAQFEKNAATPGGGSPADFKAFLVKEMQTWQEVADKAGVKIN